MSGVFFNGRMWITPAVASLNDDSAMFNKNLSVGNILAIVGKSDGGKPFTALTFGSYDEAKSVLLGGEALKAIEKAFDPSAETYAPSKIKFVRVNDETQSSLTLAAGGVPSINLVSQGYGKWTNRISVKVESGTKRGKKLSTRFGTKVYTGDNIYRRLFSVTYTGAAASASLSCDDESVTLVAGQETVEINLADAATVQDLVDQINMVSGFDAMVLDGNGLHATTKALDKFTELDLKDGAKTVTGTLQACVDWFNGSGDALVTATRADNAAWSPVNIPFTFMAGGSDGVTTMNEWARGFGVLQKEDVQWVVPISDNPAIHAMADSHCAFMSNVARMERRCIVGTNVGTTDDAAIEAAANLNSDRTSLVHLGFYDYNANGKLTLFPPYILAGLLAGMFAGVNPGTALTNKSIKIRGLERELSNPVDTDDLIEGGVLCIEKTTTGFKVTKSITTWLVNDNYNRVEVSCGVAADFTARNVRNALDPLRGKKGTPELLTEVVSRAEAALRELARPEPMGPGVIVGDDENPAYKGLTASLEGDVIRFEFQSSPVIPANYILIVNHLVPYSGTATA